MADTGEKSGQCLCGAVRLTARPVAKTVGACHCGQCRKWCGGPFMAVNCGKDVVFTGDESISVFNSSAWAERGFCNKCGSSLFYRLKQSGEHIIAAGLFGDVADLTFTNQVFIDEKPLFYNFSEDTKNLTGPEVFALYGE